MADCLERPLPVNRSPDGLLGPPRPRVGDELRCGAKRFELVVAVETDRHEMVPELTPVRWPFSPRAQGVVTIASPLPISVIG